MSSISTAHRTPKSQQQRLSPAEFRAELQRRGWSVRGLAKRWGCSENWIHKLASNSERPQHWDDAVRGLPQLMVPNKEAL